MKEKEDCDKSGADGLINMNDLTDAKKKYQADLERITKLRDEENKLYTSNERKAELTQTIDFSNYFISRLENMEIWTSKTQQLLFRNQRNYSNTFLMPVAYSHCSYSHRNFPVCLRPTNLYNSAKAPMIKRS